jgi:hypothetical protein
MPEPNRHPLLFLARATPRPNRRPLLIHARATSSPPCLPCQGQGQLHARMTLALAWMTRRRRRR